MTAPVIAPSLADCPSIRHGFFSRDGGVSGGIYASLNCGTGSDDDAAAVRENRRRVAGALGVAGDALRTLYQIHSATVIDADGAWDDGARPRADALVCTTPGTAIGVLAADCAPVLFADSEAGVIGAAHAGWRGALGGVVEATIAAMTARGARAERIAAVVGPCIAGPSYQVGPEFPAPFLEQSAKNARFFAPDPEDAARHRFDLPGYVLSRLVAAGVGEAHVTGHDTYTDPRFFSYRRATHRSEPDYGRNISAIALADGPAR